MFDGKYNNLYDSTLFRVSINLAVFIAWMGTAFLLLR